jgi:branched-subunit amino acid permease
MQHDAGHQDHGWVILVRMLAVRVGRLALWVAGAVVLLAMLTALVAVLRG